MSDEDDDEAPFGLPPLRLPPITLPPLFPDDLTLEFPAVVRPPAGGNAVLAAIALDIIDAAVLLTFGGGIVRVGIATLLAILVVGPLGAVHAWELASLLEPALGLAPSATLLALSGRLR